MSIAAHLDVENVGGNAQSLASIITYSKSTVGGPIHDVLPISQGYWSCVAIIATIQHQCQGRLEHKCSHCCEEENCVCHGGINAVWLK